jgi:crotonobetainyl-CoA:carnitine CoA-transferase CaiB-like acyl-CoA transferase
MGSPAWAAEPRFATKDTRASHEAELNGYLREWIAGWKAELLFKACQERRICACQVFRAEQLAEQEHLKAREFPRVLEQPGMGAVRIPGPPYRLLKPWGEPRGAAPRLGEAQPLGARIFNGGGVRPGSAPLASQAIKGNGSNGVSASRSSVVRTNRPLEGLRVLDFTWVWAGPHATKLLCELGADVVKVESTGRPDLMRRSGVHAKEREPGVNTRGTFNQLAQGKRSLQLSVATPEGLALAKRLAAKADVVASNFGTGVMERIGLGTEELLMLNPELVICAISGFGQTGPYRNFMGYGQAAVPLSGISALTGYRPGEPDEVHIAYGDPVAGVFGAVSIAAALLARQRYGGGQFIDVSLWESLVCTGFEGWIAALLPPHPMDNPPLAPMGNRDAWCAPYNCYRCAGDDAWVSIAVTDEGQWAALCGAMGQPALAQDLRFRTSQARKAHEDSLDAIVGGWTRGLDRWEVTRRLQAVGVGAFPSLNVQELIDDAHLAARGYFGLAPHPEVGVRAHLGAPWRMAVRPNGERGPAPLFGEHTDEVLREWLGADAREIEAWRQAGALS